MLYTAEYAGGKANGLFSIHYYEYNENDEAELFVVRGSIRDGKVQGTSTIYKDGEITGYEGAANFRQWPDFGEPSV